MWVGEDAGTDAAPHRQVEGAGQVQVGVRFRSAQDSAVGSLLPVWHVSRPLCDADYSRPRCRQGMRIRKLPPRGGMATIYFRHWAPDRGLG